MEIFKGTFLEECVEFLPRNIIKAEMKRKNVSVKEMCELLTKEGESLIETSFNNKISRGTFTAQFFFKCMKVLKVKRLEI